MVQVHQTVILLEKYDQMIFPHLGKLEKRIRAILIFKKSIMDFLQRAPTITYKFG